jgi:hypothetical protein
MLVKFAFNLSRIYEHYQRKRFAIISASRSDLLAPVNELRYKAMKKAVRELGYGYQEIKGYWKEQLGSETGNVTIEWPLFIPEVTYQDALYLGRGQWPGGDDLSQFSIVWADGTDLQELQVNVNPPRVIKQFSGFAANKLGPEDLKATAPEVIKQKTDQLEHIWQGYSEHKQKPWAYVSWTMGEPPRPSAPDVSERRAAAHWRDQEAHPFYHRQDRPYLMYQGAVYQETSQYLPSKRLPKQVVALLRRKFRVPSFSSEINVPDKNARNWDINPNNILDSTVVFREGALPQRFSWHPTSGEFLLSAPAEMHAQTIRSYGSHPFDEYVRGLVLRDQNIIATRPWAPNVDFGMMTGDPEEDRAQQFMVEQASTESQEAVKRVMTSVGGVPSSWKWRFDVTNSDLQDLTGIFRW